MSKLSVETAGESRLISTRRFNAPPETVYHAHIEPEPNLPRGLDQ